MQDIRYDLGYLTDPTVFAVGRLPAVSDHDCYLNAAEAAAEATSLRRSLNGLWRFRYSERLSERPIGFEADDFSCADWHEIHVPAHIQLEGYGKPQYVNLQYPWDGHEQLLPPQIPTEYNPVGSYVRYFDVPEGWDGSRVVLTFHGVETAFFCWLNGTLLGYAEDSFTPSHFDITSALHKGENKLAVEVFRFSCASYIEDQDFWRFSGIFRDVELTAQPKAHVLDLFAMPVLDDAYANGTLKAELSLLLPNEAVTLTSELMDSNGKVVDCYSTEAKPQTTLERAIASPSLWSAEQPALYTLRLTLTGKDGQVFEVAQTRIGFRRFEFKNGLMQLNGKRILFRGTNRHEFCMEAGRAITPKHMLADIAALKRNNINAVRTSHYPNQGLWYKLCDEYGIYLIDECNLESHGSWQRPNVTQPEWVVPNDDPAWLPTLIDRATSMQERDKNHPSVLIWSCGNESRGGKDIFEMSEHLRKRDPSRLVHYEGVVHDRRYNATSDIESRMYPPADEIAEYLTAHTDKPFILCEYTHAMGNSCGGMHKYIALEDEFSQYQGGFIWDMVDQAILVTAPNGKPRLAYGGDFGERPTDRDFCGNGIFFADRTPTPKLQEVKYLYQPVRLTPDAQGVTIENRALFQNASAYVLRWQLKRNGEAVQCGVLAPLDVPAGETRHFELPVLTPTLSGEYLLHCGLFLSTAAAWADTDYELMHGEALLATLPEKAPLADTASVISRGDVNIGVRSDHNEMLFSFAEGGICSLRGNDGRELLSTVPALSLFRAPTNNDKGNGDLVSEALWQAASLHAVSVPQAAEVQDGKLHVCYHYDLPLTGGAAVDMCYTALTGGKLRVDMHYHGKQGLPDMAAFGVSLRLPREYCNALYYGLGPAENYSDRKHGASLGLYTTTAQENLTPYLQPQECGNREGVRYLCLTNKEGRGLRVEQVDQPFSASVLPYNAMELFTALHQDELAEPTYTYLNIALKRKGVGGDDSWHAPVHPEYHIPADQPMTFSFVIGILN
ncbi:MAG: glycoside hydrolase family 2 TIM barrel-domain containing protein [Clostridia bacterium]